MNRLRYNISTTVSGYIFVLFAATCWGLIGPLAKFILAEGISPQEISFWRSVFGGAFFLIHAIICNLLQTTLKEKIIFSGFGVIGIAILFTVYQISVKESGAALASILLYTAPIWVIVFSTLFFKEPLTKIKVIAVFTALFGVVLLSVSGGSLTNKASVLGIACGLISGFCYSLHYVFTKKYLAKHSPITLYAYCLPFGALTLFPVTTFATKDSTSWVILIVLGFLCTYLAYFSYCKGMERLNSTKVAITANLEPVIASLFAWWWWNEFFSPLGWLGASFVFLAILLIVLQDKPKSPQNNML